MQYASDDEAVYCREGEKCWVEGLLEDDEMSAGEAAFLQGYNDAEEEGFD